MGQLPLIVAGKIVIDIAALIAII